MPVNGTSTSPGTSTTRPKAGPASRSDSAKIREGFTKVRNGSVSYARHTAERTVDVPVGAALSVADRVTDIVEPFTARQTANRELKSIRTRVERELNRLERRGATARRKTRTRSAALAAGSSVSSPAGGAGSRRRSSSNRTRAENQVKHAQNVVSERVATLV